MGHWLLLVVSEIYFADLGDLLRLADIVIEMVFNFHFLIVLLNQQIGIKFLIILLKLVEPILRLLILPLTPLKVLIQFRVGLLHFLDVLLVLVELVHQSDVVKLA